MTPPSAIGVISEDNSGFASTGAPFPASSCHDHSPHPHHTRNHQRPEAAPDASRVHGRQASRRTRREPMMSSSKMYVCIKCHANFKTGDGKPDPRLRGLGRCNNCLGVAAANATTPSPTA